MDVSIHGVVFSIDAPRSLHDMLLADLGPYGVPGSSSPRVQTGWSIVLSTAASVTDQEVPLLREPTDECGVSYAFDIATRTVYAICDEPADSLDSLRRLIRYVARTVVQSRGAVPVHAAAVGWAHTDAGAVIIGPKQAGKTTTMLAACVLTGASFCSNDDAMLEITGGEVRALGWPRSLNIRLDTIDMIDALAVQQFGGAGSSPDLTSLRSLSPLKSRYIVSPSKIAAVTRRPTTSTLRPGVIALTSFASDGWDCRRLGAEETFERLLGNIEPISKNRDTLDRAFPLNPDRQASLLADVSERVPAFAIRQTGDTVLRTVEFIRDHCAR